MAKNEQGTVVKRISTHANRMLDKIQKIVAVESGGEVIDKLGPLEVALEEFLDKREDKRRDD